MVWTIRIVVLLLIGGTALGILLAELILRISHSSPGGDPGNYSLTFETVEIEAPDGVKLTGWWVPGNPGEGTVLVCHGYGADKADSLPFAQFLNEAGFGVLVMDFRGHGGSGGKTGSLGEREVPDLEAVVDALHEEDRVRKGRLGVFGYSMGGAMAILAASEDERIRAVAADCAYADAEEVLVRWFQEAISVPRYPVIWAAIHWAEFRLGCDYSSLAPEDRISGIAPRPLLIIHGEGDDLIPVDHARRLYEAAGEPKELWVVPGAGHVGAFDRAGDRYREKVVGFFREAFDKGGTAGSGA
jgi:dipeptidyl aminopeptidase/acylaminoacyl peptidase